MSSNNFPLRKVRLLLMGFGNVGRAFARLLLEKEASLLDKYGLQVSVTGISTARHGACIDPDGLNLSSVLRQIEAGEHLSAFNKITSPTDAQGFIATCPADLLIETTPLKLADGQPALDHMLGALQHGMHAITANKGPLVFGFERLKKQAICHDREFRYEATVMDGAPIFSLFRSSLRGAELLGFTAILNSCSNYILGLMEDGLTLAEAIAHAQAIGIAETDPSLDVDGWDAAIKLAALSTVLMEHPLTPQEVNRTGIRGVSPAMIAEARAHGERWKLICTASRLESGEFQAEVAPQRLGPTSPFYSVDGTSSLVRFHLDVLPSLGILETDPSPKTTAFGLLSDLLDIYTTRGA